jgi:hypothetical protein
MSPSSARSSASVFGCALVSTRCAAPGPPGLGEFFVILHLCRQFPQLLFQSRHTSGRGLSGSQSRHVINNLRVRTPKRGRSATTALSAAPLLFCSSLPCFPKLGKILGGFQRPVFPLRCTSSLGLALLLRSPADFSAECSACAFRSSALPSSFGICRRLRAFSPLLPVRPRAR